MRIALCCAVAFRVLGRAALVIVNRASTWTEFCIQWCFSRNDSKRCVTIRNTLRCIQPHYVSPSGRMRNPSLAPCCRCCCWGDPWSCECDCGGAPAKGREGTRHAVATAHRPFPTCLLAAAAAAAVAFAVVVGSVALFRCFRASSTRAQVGDGEWQWRAAGRRAESRLHSRCWVVTQRSRWLCACVCVCGDRARPDPVLRAASANAAGCASPPTDG